MQKHQTELRTVLEELKEGCLRLKTELELICLGG